MHRFLLSLTALAIAAPASAQTTPPAPQEAPAAPVAPAPEFKARIDELPAILGGTGNYESFFDPGFQAAVPKARFAEISSQVVASNGPVGRVEGVTAITPYSGIVMVGFRDAVGTIQIAVDPNAPHRVTGLRITGFTAREATLDQVGATLRGLRGTTGYAIARLRQGAPELTAQYNADRPFAVGSAFKLVILAELIRQTNAGTRKWDDLVTLDGSLLPGGGYNLKPKGTQVSLRELATQMISVSDNSATDILLKTLGREKVEAMMPAVGIKEPARSRPFLSTMELFKLKGIGQGELARRYLALDEAGRRAMLAGEVANAPAIAISPTLFKDGKPVMIEQLEWFFTPADLVRVMDWLRRNTEGPKGAEARAVLSKNPGIAPASRAGWQWIGYKGGSEPGVMNMTLLLQAKAGDWYAITASWNDPAQEVEQARFAALVGRAAELAAP